MPALLARLKAGPDAEWQELHQLYLQALPAGERDRRGHAARCWAVEDLERALRVEQVLNLRGVPARSREAERAKLARIRLAELERMLGRRS